MFLNVDHVQRVLGQVDKKVTIGGMGVKEISIKALALFDRLCCNIAPLVHMTGAEVLLAVDKVFPEGLRGAARSYVQEKVNACGAELPTGDFPYADLQVRMRDVFRTCQMIGPTAIVAVSAAMEFGEQILMQRIIEKKKPSTISRGDIGWIVTNDSDMAALFAA